MVSEVELSVPDQRLKANPLRSLGYCAALTAASIAALVLILVVGVGSQSSDSSLGSQYQELLQAARSQSPYRLAMLLDATVWMLIGAGLVLIALAVANTTPLRALLIGACGAGQLIGAQGGYLRMDGTADLASRFAVAAADQKPAILQSYLALQDVINAHFHEGVLLQAVGLLVSGWVLFQLSGFPRWLAALIWLPGLTATIAWLGRDFVAQLPFFPFVFFHVVVALLGVQVVIALRLWGRRADRVLAGRAIGKGQ